MDSTDTAPDQTATRGALVQYVLQRYQIDPIKIQAKAAAQ